MSIGALINARKKIKTLEADAEAHKVDRMNLRGLLRTCTAVSQKLRNKLETIRHTCVGCNQVNKRDDELLCADCFTNFVHFIIARHGDVANTPSGEKPPPPTLADFIKAHANDNKNNKLPGDTDGET